MLRGLHDQGEEEGNVVAESDKGRGRVVSEGWGVMTGRSNDKEDHYFWGRIIIAFSQSQSFEFSDSANRVWYVNNFLFPYTLKKNCEQNGAQKNSYINSNKSGFCAEKFEAANDMKVAELGI